jgi:hypothetical protein
MEQVKPFAPLYPPYVPLAVCSRLLLSKLFHGVHLLFYMKSDSYNLAVVERNTTLHGSHKISQVPEESNSYLGPDYDSRSSSDDCCCGIKPHLRVRSSFITVARLSLLHKRNHEHRIATSNNMPCRLGTFKIA